MRRIEVKVAGRSNVPRWGKQGYGENTASPETSENTVHGSDRVNETVLESEDNRDPLPSLRKSGKDMEKELREIDEALIYAPPNLEVTNEAEESISTSSNLESRKSNKKADSISVGGEVDKEIEDLRNRVILQDIFGKNDMDGKRSYSRKKKSGKENLPCNGNHDTMFEVHVQGKSRAGWKRIPREQDTITDEGVTMSLLGKKRAGSWLDGQPVDTKG
ncbi:hypothetical protein FCV25MIE_20084 [Fagus crenata]